MGKDNITFHTVIFPSTLIGTQQPWTKLHHLSTTEFLNYEIDEKTGKPKKFSKSRNVGVFGDDAMNTGIPSEVWRYYLLINRPENNDTVFMWDDFAAKNNNELLANLGNFSNRVLKFLANSYSGVVPEGSFKESEKALWAKLRAKVADYLVAMEAVRLKEGLSCCMQYSMECNGFMQSSAPWELFKKEKERCDDVMFCLIQSLYLLATIIEPFMPSFSAKVYEQLAVKRDTRHETLLLSLIHI